MPNLPAEIELAIIGEPTLMDIAIAEKGLIVFDLVVEKDIKVTQPTRIWTIYYKSTTIIEKISNMSFAKSSKTLGDVKLTVTQINAGVQHNVVPSEVKIVLDAELTIILLIRKFMII